MKIQIAIDQREYLKLLCETVRTRQRSAEQAEEATLTNLMAKFALAMDVPVTTLMCSACATFEATRRKHYGTTHCMLGGAIDGGHCDILFAYTNVRIVDKVANDESRKKKARQLSESARANHGNGR